MVDIFQGDIREVLRFYPDDSFDSVVTDPPYNMKIAAWDKTDVAFREDTWQEIYRVLKPGGYIVSFGGGTTYHRMACAIEDAGFKVINMIGWLYAQGNPKTAKQLKTALEPICLAQKAGDGDLNIKACRFPVRGKAKPKFPEGKYGTDSAMGNIRPVLRTADPDPDTRYPSTVFISDDEILGEKACFFFNAKPTSKERGALKHKTLKPISLMRELVKLVTPEGGTVLDPFMGSGTAGVAAVREGFDFVGIDIGESAFLEARDRLSQEFDNTMDMIAEALKK